MNSEDKILKKLDTLEKLFLNLRDENTKYSFQVIDLKREITDLRILLRACYMYTPYESKLREEVEKVLGDR